MVFTSCKEFISWLLRPSKLSFLLRAFACLHLVYCQLRCMTWYGVWKFWTVCKGLRENRCVSKHLSTLTSKLSAQKERNDWRTDIQKTHCTVMKSQHLFKKKQNIRLQFNVFNVASVKRRPQSFYISLFDVVTPVSYRLITLYSHTWSM